ncbi:uncharacterized protein METZ01_LOCUS239691 [marine metagenome]|uniref:Uncharacterized protein n=1 Tax=marine metagenome TaxID=408172 RepID=A0A382HIS8_9ZZZZ
MFKKVDFPEPDGPTIETIQFFFKSKDNSFIIVNLL